MKLKINEKRSLLSTLVSATIITESLCDFVHYPLSKNKVSNNIIEKRSTSDNTLEFVIENQQSYYSVELIIGSDDQKLSALLDTGSSDLWVLGANSNNVTACDAYLESAGYISSSSSSKRDYSSSEKRAVLPHHISPIENSDIFLNGLESVLEARDDDFENFSSYLATALDYTTITASSTAYSGSSSSAVQEEVQEVEANCNDFGVFTPSDSTTFKKNHTDSEFYISYGDATFASGYWGSDQLTINGVAVEGLLFGVANMSNSSNVLGISFPALESSNQQTSTSDTSTFTYSNLPQLLKSSGLINKVVYSLYLNSLEATSGDLLFGALDTSKYTGNLYTVPLINIYSRYYDEPIEFDITLQGSGFISSSGVTTTFSTQYVAALLDSGTTLLYLPQTLADMFASKVSAKWDDDLQYYTMTCPSDKTAENSAYVFNIGGVNYYVPLSNYILQTSQSSVCVLGIQPQSTQYCILGDNTLSALYIVYDLEDYEISIAQADFSGASNSSIIEIESTIPGATNAPGYNNTWTATVSKITSGGNIFSSTSASNPWTATSSIYFESTSISTQAMATAEGDGSTVTLSTSAAISGTSTRSSTSNTSSSTSSTATSRKNEAGTNFVGYGSVVAIVMSLLL
ncbi:hypothetical protein QEN19_001910 [Hanseniaspora menglaensis]